MLFRSKTSKNNILLAAVTTLLFTVSCVSVKEYEATELSSFDSVSAVVINPITEKANISDAIGKSITTTLTNSLAADIRYAGDIPKLQPTLSKNNLIADGQVNMSELSRIGNAVNAKEVICVKVNSISYYKPQSIAALVIVRSAEGSKYRQKVGFVNISLNDPEHKKEFASFVGGDLIDPLVERFTRKTNINAETAELSNDEFARFVGYKIAKHILFMKKY